MARFAYECSGDTKATNVTEAPLRPIACNHDNICIYCCCEPQCCLLIQKNPPKHFWEAWYFWLGVALLVLFIVSSISSYIVKNCRHSLQTLLTPESIHVATRPEQTPNELISIHVIPTPGGIIPIAHRKLLLCAPESSSSHMTPIVA